MKHCVDCSFYSSGKCTKQGNPVTGGPSDGWRGNASLQREDGFLASVIMNTCGLRAKWFKEKTQNAG